MTSVLHHIALTQVLGVGSVSARQLIKYCGSAEQVFSESKQALLAIPNIGPKIIEALNNKKIFIRAEEELKFTERYRIKILTYQDPEYPQRLNQCADAPTVLYFKGNADLNASRIVNIIGTRHISPYGQEIVKQIVEELSSFSPLIVSGLAYGVDILAHKESMQKGCSTVGVMGHGLDTIYPSVHRAVAEDMIKQGGLLTEFVSHSKPTRQNFPKRNRIVAGMSDACIVVEAGLNSGALITAHLANDYNRDVFAFPGRIFDNTSVGCNELIQTNTAQLVTSGKDIVEMLGWSKGTQPKREEKLQQSLFLDLSEDEQKIINLLSQQQPVLIDNLTIETQFPFSLLSKILLNLELKGVIKQLPGKAYVLG